MNRDPFPHALALFVAQGFLLAPSVFSMPQDAVPAPVSEALSAEPTRPKPELHEGERIDPALFGPALIEGLDAVLAREAARPAGELLFPKDRNGRHGVWMVPSLTAAVPTHSGTKYVFNEWGDTRMGIGFGATVELQGAWIHGQSGPGVWPRALRAVGYKAGEQTGVTDWFEEIDATPRWFAIGLPGIDRVVIEARPAMNGAAWFGLDDLCFTPNGATDPRVIDFEDLDFRRRLTGSGYAGLSWEEGTGEFRQDEGVHAPLSPPGEQREVEVGGTDSPSGGNGTAPILQSSFECVLRGDAGSMSFPPDTAGAAGPDQIVVTVNRNFAVFDKHSGAELVNVLLGSFLPGSNGDPRVLFDQHSGRWVVIVSDFDTKIFLAFSMTSDALGSWFKTSIVVSQGSDSGCFPDYPTLGVDANGIYTSAYMVGCAMSIFAIDKAPLLGATPALGAVTAFRSLTYEGAIQPCHTYGAPAGEYFVSTNTSTRLRLRRLSGPMTAPTLQTVGFATVPSYSNPPDAPALGSTTPLDTVDDRLMNAVFSNGSVFAAHSISVGGRAACRWYELDVTSITAAQIGTISDSTLYYFFPGVAVNPSDDVVIGFSGSSASQFASAYYAGRRASDPPGEMSSPALLRAGSAAQNNIDSFGRNRWGDYSLSSLDPGDPTTLWTIQEYAHGSNIWGTWIGKLLHGIPTPVTYCSAKANSLGCLPAISFVGGASATAGSGFSVNASQARNNKIGILLHGATGRASTAFQGGLLCVANPIRRSPAVDSGGSPAPTNDCSGVYAVDMNAFAVGALGGTPMPALGVVGTLVDCQWWGRDPGGLFDSSLSNGLEYTVGP